MVARMVAGMDVTMYRPDDELKKLAALAVELDLADLFVEGAEPAKGLTALGERGDAGAPRLAAPDVADGCVGGAEPAKVLTALGERGEAGARWLSALEEAKDPWFNVSVGD